MVAARFALTDVIVSYSIELTFQSELWNSERARGLVSTEIFRSAGKSYRIPNRRSVINVATRAADLRTNGLPQRASVESQGKEGQIVARTVCGRTATIAVERILASFPGSPRRPVVAAHVIRRSAARGCYVYHAPPGPVSIVFSARLKIVLGYQSHERVRVPTASDAETSNSK